MQRLTSEVLCDRGYVKRANRLLLLLLNKTGMSFLKNIFGFGPKVDFAELIVNGATIIDVRSPQEFKSGNPAKSINIPLDQIPSKMNKIKKMKEPIIVCCASGMRSGRAKGMIAQAGLEVHNAGSWKSIS
jgi:phage shock protein E|tara:strand:- start:175762 stop:176151 length:390 start_codon:yes stop_codon:yes gene_type:complete